MCVKKIAIFVLLVLLLSFSIFSQVSAHQTVTQGPYNFEIGWLNEPAIAGQVNAIVMNVSYSNGSAAAVPYDGTNLVLTVSYGGQSTALPLEPRGGNAPGQYIAPILPTTAGAYTVDVTGSIGTYDDIEVEVQPEAVLVGNPVQFPQVNSPTGQNNFRWTEGIGLAALVISLGTLTLSIMALRKKR